MCTLDLFSSEKLSGKRILNSYIISDSPIEYCKKIIDMPEFKPSEIRLSLEGEEMQPNRRFLVSSLDELINLSKNEIVDSCVFEGSYNGEEAGICVDYGLMMINVVSEDSEVIEAIKKNLER